MIWNKILDIRCYSVDYSVDINHEPYKVLPIFELHAKPFKCSTYHNFRTKHYTDNKIGLQTKQNKKI